VGAIDDFEVAIRAMDAKLRPIAKSPAVTSNEHDRPNAPSTGSGLPEARRSPFEAANIAEDANPLIEQLSAFYASALDSERTAVRGLFKRYDSFRWAAGWHMLAPDREMTTGRFRDALILFSIKDQGSDWRDAIVWLDRLCAQALRAGVPVSQPLIDVAALSSDEVPFPAFKSARSTRAMLLDMSRRLEDASRRRAHP